MAPKLPSSEEGRGLREAAVAFGQGLFSVRRATAQTITAGAGNTVIEFATAEYNPDGWYSTTTFKYIPKKPGYYLFTTELFGTDLRTNTVLMGLTVNGTLVRTLAFANSGKSLTGSCIYYMNGNADYAQIVASATTDNLVLDPTAARNWFQGVLISTKP